MSKFVYWDNSAGVHSKFIGSVVANTITEADEIVFERTMIDPRKTPTVGCQVYKAGVLPAIGRLVRDQWYKRKYQTLIWWMARR